MAESETETETLASCWARAEKGSKRSLPRNSAATVRQRGRQRHTQQAEIDTAAITMRTRLLLSLGSSSDGVKDQVLANDAGLSLWRSFRPLHLKSRLEFETRS